MEYLIFQERKKKWIIIKRKKTKIEIQKKLSLNKTEGSPSSPSFDLLKIPFHDMNRKKIVNFPNEIDIGDSLWRKRLLNSSIIIQSEQKEKEIYNKENTSEKKNQNHIKLEGLHSNNECKQNKRPKKYFRDSNKDLLKSLILKKSKTLELSKLNNFATSTTENNDIQNYYNLNSKFRSSFKLNCAKKNIERKSLDQIIRKEIQQVTLTEMKIFDLPNRKKTFYL